MNYTNNKFIWSGNSSQLEKSNVVPWCVVLCVKNVWSKIFA